uniref:RanBP2-type domain-containing protein n=1 Tax=Oncorhynchus tshawytscha TaxID=74940 RepID=A0A8C8C8J6_ONCTS
MGDKKSPTRPKRQAKPSADDGYWDCSVCTFKNSAEAFKCSICDVRKGTSTRKPRINSQLVAQQVAQQYATPPPPKKERKERPEREHDPDGELVDVEGEHHEGVRPERVRPDEGESPLDNGRKETPDNVKELKVEEEEKVEEEKVEEEKVKEEIEISPTRPITKKPSLKEISPTRPITKKHSLKEINPTTPITKKHSLKEISPTRPITTKPNNKEISLARPIIKKPNIKEISLARPITKKSSIKKIRPKTDIRQSPPSDKHSVQSGKSTTKTNNSHISRPKLKNIDRSTAQQLAITVGNVTVIITDFKEKTRSSSTSSSTVTSSAGSEQQHQSSGSESMDKSSTRTSTPKGELSVGQDESF